jgi:hypothetical protein
MNCESLDGQRVLVRGRFDGTWSVHSSIPIPPCHWLQTPDRRTRQTGILNFLGFGRRRISFNPWTIPNTDFELPDNGTSTNATTTSSPPRGLTFARSISFFRPQGVGNWDIIAQEPKASLAYDGATVTTAVRLQHHPPSHIACIGAQVRATGRAQRKPQVRAVHTQLCGQGYTGCGDGHYQRKPGRWAVGEHCGAWFFYNFLLPRFPKLFLFTVRVVQAGLLMRIL